MLRWIRGFYLKPVPLMIVGYTFVLIYATQTTVILAAVSAGLWLQGLISLTVRVRRAESADR
jgi:hypothetical protein